MSNQTADLPPATNGSSGSTANSPRTELIPKPMDSALAARPNVSTANARLNISAMPDPIGLLRSFRRRWLMALVCGTFAAAIVGPATWFICHRLMQPRYTAYALLRVSAGKPTILYNIPSPDDYRFRQTQLVLITSRYVVGAAMRRNGIS